MMMMMKKMMMVLNDEEWCSVMLNDVGGDIHDNGLLHTMICLNLDLYIDCLPEARGNKPATRRITTNHSCSTLQTTELLSRSLAASQPDMATSISVRFGMKTNGLWGKARQALPCDF